MQSLSFLSSCNHMPCVLKCRTLPMPALWDIPRAAALSQYNSQSNDNPKSAEYAAMAMVSADAPTIAYNSASAELRATTFCCLQYVLITCSPMQIAPPLVDRAVREQPAQSLSVNAVIFVGASCHLNNDISRGWPRRYFQIFRNHLKSDGFGQLIFLAASLTA